MNGVRRFLSNATTSELSPTPAIIKDRTSTPSRPSSPTKELPPPPPATKALFIRKDRRPPLPVSDPSSTASSPTTSTSSPRRKPPPSEWDQTPSPSHNHANTNDVQRANTRDALLLSLLSSEAMVDSRDYVILSAEEVEELKKVCKVFSVYQISWSPRGSGKQRSSAIHHHNRDLLPTPYCAMRNGPRPP